jgi:tetratricopeptide (TPR) repeat protein
MIHFNLPSIQRVFSSKKFVYYVIILIFPVTLFVLFEFSLRIFHYGKDFSLFIAHPDKTFQNFKIVNPEIGAKYFRNFEYSYPKNDLFLKIKEPGCLRIFVMGSSTAAGFPYESNLMFSRIFQKRLQDAYPEKRIEVINTAITAINSFTLADFIDDILAEKPDAILIYAGHNEYYGAFGTGSNEGIGKNRGLIKIHFKLMNLRIYQLINNILRGVSGSFNHSVTGSQHGTLMSRIVRNADIKFQSDDYTEGIENFKKNMSDILRKATGKNVPVFLSTLVCNIKDVKPLSSVNSESTDSAFYYFSKAGEAESQYDFREAKTLYYKAKDLDGIRFRAPSDINKAIEELANRYKVNLVPMLDAFEEKSPYALVGDNLLTEHVHPNISGYFLMAEVFYNSIIKSKIIRAEPDVKNLRTFSSFQNSYGYTSFDSLVGYHKIGNLKYHWPFRDETQAYTDYREIYKPVNFIDSLAFGTLKNKILGIVEGHLILAKKYIRQKDQINAFREYKAIIQIAPATPELLRESGSFFISAGDLPLALKCYTQSLEFEQSYYASFRSAEILLIQNDYQKAAQYFTKAFKTAGEEYKLNILTKLYLCYYYLGKKNEANQVYQSIRQLQPSIKIQTPAKSYSFADYIPVEIKSNVEKAVKLLQDMKVEEALFLLLTCADTNDAPVVNRMIGSIYARQQDWVPASFYLQKAYMWFKFEPGFLSMIINVHIYAGDFSEAQDCLKQLQLIEPANAEIPVFQQSLKGK